MIILINHFNFLKSQLENLIKYYLIVLNITA